MNQKPDRIKQIETITAHSIPLLLILVAVSVIFNIEKTTPAQSEPIQTLMTIPPSLKPLNSPEVFGPDNLYEKINGQAELYLSAGLVRLESQWFAESENADLMFEVYIYHMGDRLNAFSVYSVQRNDDAQKIGFTQFAYRTESSLYLVHGPYYVEMISAAPSESMFSKMTSLAKNFINDTPVETKSIKRLGFFPQENLDYNSMTLIARDAFGFDGLDRVFTARYTIGGRKVTAFISKRKTPQEAKEFVIGLHRYFISFGGKDVTLDIAVKDVKMVEIMDFFDIMFSINSYLAGVHEASTKTDAKEVAEGLAKTLREAIGKK
jgi:hypothetical protein